MPKIFGFIAAAWIVLVLCTWIPTPGSALKCHVCNSLHNESCESITDDTYLMECDDVETDNLQNYTNCRKIVFSAFSKKFEMHTERTIRSCGYEKHPRLSCFYSSNIDLKGTTCECTEDGCNKSITSHFAWKILLLVVSCGFLASLLAT